MKKVLFLLPLLAVLLTSMRGDCITKDGYFRGKRLCGKVKVVTSFPDLKVKAVNSFADDPGEWEFVENFPDFTIEYVENFPDFKIEFVNSFPGVANPCR